MVIVGDGPDRASLEHALPNATFLGMRRGADLASIFAGLDVFVHTGEHETFCQTIQEAQASGVATVGPAAGGPLDLIRPGETGLLFEPGQPGSLRDAVKTLLDNPDSPRARWPRAGRSRVQTRTWPAVVDDLVDRHYAEVLARSRGRTAGGMRERSELIRQHSRVRASSAPGVEGGRR